MPAKVLVVAQLLSCCSLAVMALSLMEGPALDFQMRGYTIEEFQITTMRLDRTASTASLQLCAAVGLLPKGSPQLTVGVFPQDTSNQIVVDGDIDATSLDCANFVMDLSFTLPDVTTRYEMRLINSVTFVMGKGVSTFAMTAKTTLLTCNPDLITKVIWDDPTLVVSTSCIAMDTALTGEAVCYYSGDIMTEDFCFEIQDQEEAKINICMNGLTSFVAPEGAVSASYFYYGSDTDADGAATAKLSLAMDAGSSTDMRAIMRLAAVLDPPGGPGEATVYDCPSNECTFATYTRKSALYEVCVDAMDGSKVTLGTGTITFTDMNLNAFDGGSQKSTLMEFVFANGQGGDMTYSASYSLEAPAEGVLGDAQANTVNVDCSGVAPGHACFGFLDIGTALETVYLALSGPNNVNTIVAPYVIQSPESLL